MIQNYATTPTTPPQVIGTVSGNSGQVYFISADGYMYYRGNTGNYVSFGRLQKLTTPEQATAVTGTVIGAAGGTGASTGTTVTTPGTVSTDTGTTSTTTSDNDADDVHRHRDRDRDRDHDGDHRWDRNKQVTITGTVVGNTGKLYYLSADGYLYYRGSDGNLHIVGSGAPE